MLARDEFLGRTSVDEAKPEIVVAGVTGDDWKLSDGRFESIAAIGPAAVSA